MHKAGQPWQVIMDNGPAKATHLFLLYLWFYFWKPAGFMRGQKQWGLNSGLCLLLHHHNDHACGTGERVEKYSQEKTFWSSQGYNVFWQPWVGGNDEAENCAIISVFLVWAQQDAGSILPTLSVPVERNLRLALVLIWEPLTVFTFRVHQGRLGSSDKLFDRPGRTEAF